MDSQNPSISAAMSRNRDFRAEYQRRLARAAARGLSRSQARGHARVGEASIRAKLIQTDTKLEVAFKALRSTKNLSAAAKAERVSPERLRRYLREKGLIERKGRTWLFPPDLRPRRTVVFTGAEAREITLADFEQASLNGRHQDAVRQFLRSNDAQFLLPFYGQSVVDTKGKSHPLETDPNALHQIASAGNEPFHQIYRIVQ